MSMVKVYDREGNELCEINTEHFLYNNDDIGPEPTKFDINLYPYVKVDGVYYLNDGEEFFSTTRANNSASLMRIESAYQWKGSDPFNSNSIPGEWVKGITVDKMDDRGIITEDITDIDGNIVSQHVLKSIAAYHTIPNYFVGDKEKKNFKSLSFDYNVKNNSDNKDHDGQYIFSKDVQYKGGAKKDTEYWSMAPQVYPVVVFDNMNSTEESIFEIDNYHFKKYKITFTNNVLTVSGKSMIISDNDEVVFYIRRCGEWISDKEVKFPGFWVVEKNSEIEVLDQQATGTLTMPSIEMYTTQEITTPFTTDTNDINKLISNSSLCSKPYYKQIIHTLDTKYNLPPMIGAKWAARYNILTGKSFFGIGDWDYKWTLVGGWQATLRKNTYFTMSAQIKNFQYIDVDGSFAYLKHKPGDIVAEVQEPVWDQGRLNAIQEASFFRSWTPIVGSFPREVGFFKDGQSDGEFYGSRDSGYVRINNLHYKYLQSIYDSNQEQYYDDSLDFKVGWESQHPHDTFALAIVVWKNGKLIPEEQ